MIYWTTEWPLIKDAALLYGVDPYFIAAIRHSENGSAGREYGVLSENAPTYQEQLNDCCASVRNKLKLFNGNPFEFISKRNLVATLSYLPSFIKFFSNTWAPPNVTNDPNNLNTNWYSDTLKFYQQAKYSDSIPTTTLVDPPK